MVSRLSSSIAVVAATLLATVNGQGPCFRNNAFSVNARACEDVAEIAICQVTFPIVDGKPSERCFHQTYTDFAALCRKTCFSCCTDPAYNCPDRSDTPFPCAEQFKACNMWRDVMTHYCPGTCGFCEQTTCRDMRSDCAQFKTLCTDPTFSSTMEGQCPMSCGFCDDDKPNNNNNNNNGGGNNGGKPINVYCVDSDARCPFWKSNGFCHNPQYDVSKCRKSCGLC